MRRSLAATAVLLALTVPLPARAATWDIDPVHTGVRFKVRHLMVSNVRGTFGKVSGTVQYDEKDFTKASADITIDAASIDTGVAKRDQDLKGPDFLDVARYPTLTFKSRRVEATAGGGLRMIGDLAIHGVTREAALDIDRPAPAIKDPWGKTRMGGAATLKIDRKDFGLTYSKTLETGGLIVGDEVAIDIDVEIVRR